jgi:magnesium transporter
VADGQVRYLQGVIGFYKARTDTKMTIAAERLALIAVVMAVMSATLLRSAKRQRWW